MSATPWKPHVTVAAVAEQNGHFLLVEELIEGNLVLNQPAGHLDENESLLTAVIREAREETAWEFEPDALVGFYLWKSPTTDESFLRAAFSGRCLQHHPYEPLDTGIQRAVWMSHVEILAARDRLRSPLVLRCIEDYLLGRRFPLTLVRHLDDSPSISSP